MKRLPLVVLVLLLAHAADAQIINSPVIWGSLTPSNYSTACVPSIGSAGTYTIAAGGLFFWPYGTAPVNGLDCIASTTVATSISSGK